MTLGKIFFAMNQTDSVAYYINLLKDDLNKLDSTNKSDLYTAASIYAFFVKKYNKNKQYDSAFYYQQKYTNLADKIYNNNLQESIYEVQKKYDFEAEQNRHNLELLNRQRIITIISIVLLFATIVIILFGIRLVKKTKKESFLHKQLFISQQKNIELNEQQEMLNADIDKMKQEMAEFEKENNDLQNTTKINEIKQQISNLKSELERSAIQLENNMIWRISLLCQVANNDNTTLVPKEAQLKQIRKTILGENTSSWESIMELVDKTYPRLIQTIKNIPELSETEFRICVLTFINLAAKDIADILDIKVNSVNTSRSRIRKKMNIDEIGGSISEAIKKTIDGKN